LWWLLRGAWRIEAADECSANSGSKPSSLNDGMLVWVVVGPSSLAAAGSAP
jgi:hypothetical protein